MSYWPYQIVIALIDDGAEVGPGVTRMARAGALTASVSGEAADVRAWAEVQPRWVDASGQRYAVACQRMRPGDAAQIPMLLALACPDGDPSTLVAEATTGRAYALDGALLGAYEMTSTPGGRVAQPAEALRQIGVAPESEDWPPPPEPEEEP